MRFEFCEELKDRNTDIPRSDLSSVRQYVQGVLSSVGNNITYLRRKLTFEKNNTFCINVFLQFGLHYW